MSHYIINVAKNIGSEANPRFQHYFKTQAITHKTHAMNVYNDLCRAFPTARDVVSVNLETQYGQDVTVDFREGRE
jgi:hypothetical protein